ncbi:DNA recombination protein RmuC [Anaerohalosphaera lusitana]|uniref:DNA recombination protein RmuC n=1 Tax=Anaerohalosphaera lusitana TaxID=1936003 RepID=A0A1U9NIN0_9BACT|nr:DNA recombination protein RmuC [Anaerohalosphaera lusitana]AQT67584.1 DNA recombination protein RmuC [Anaerohalosphaera lusitana]
MEILITIVVILTVLVLILLAVLMLSNNASRRDLAAQSASINMLTQQLDSLKGSQDNISQTLEKNLTTGQQNITRTLQASHETLSKLHTQIGHLQGSSSQILQLGTDVRKLQDILKSPKMRGQLGERSLENLLSDILPAGSFNLQHPFKSGKIVDALITLPDYSVPVDAKFPLPSFEAMLAAENDDLKKRLRRQFQSDVVKHIDKIAAQYINPDEGTLDFALMYIPAENVYYETIIKYETDRTDVLNHALEKKVIPVSPNLLYVYLMTIVMGLHGLQIEKQAARIRTNLGKLSGLFDDITQTYTVLGKHLKNAYSQYDEGQKRIDRFSMNLDQITNDHEETPE